MTNSSDTKATDKSSQSKMLRGSAWMTAGSIFSRILGAIYVIPWPIWFGVNFLAANNLFGRGYQIYSVLIVVSTAGIPGALSKQIAHYNEMNEYGVGQKLFQKSLILMLIMGILSAGALYLLAPVLSQGDARMIPVFHSLCWPLLVIPLLSIMRGFFQGYAEMAPSAISQFIEQVARVIYMTVTVFVITQVLRGSYIDAVTQATFAAFIGAVAGLLLLIWHYLKQRPRIEKLIAGSNNAITVSMNDLLKGIIKQSIPFIVIDASINLVYIIDQYSFNRMMSDFVIASDHQLWNLYTLFAVNANKLISITVSLAAAMAVTAVPLMSAAHVRGNQKELRQQIGSTIQLFNLVMIPAAFGMAAVAEPLYTLFYSHDALGISVLQFSSYISILLGLFTVLGAILQGLYQNRLALFYLLIGFIVKIVAQYPAIYFFRVYGPLVSTGLAFATSSILMLAALHRYYHFDAWQTIRRLIGIVGFSVIMYLMTSLTVKGLLLVFNPQSRLQSVLVLAISVAVGGLVYAVLALKSRLADYVLGSNLDRFRRKLKLK
ncbi:polysaccharide biosynthesis protein [Latilactobacillus sakei subsp. carnosus]|uniref:putative polysaccharide biosynthesis protein n=1 Tax=Latilactobacillus TaxID=2767885 RepID=UPI000C12483A|nr:MULTISPECIES: polysaccharide biosynthesis protein [Latilactobacillus]MCM1570985.1 polysaccharide biosynthesis protein [Latilactobacillus sakei]MDV8937647.1 polysaccharide biosynthesis protein [Latilactobacillus sp.]MDV8939335.1 polysaccharide biosynthesis protein [Latilactobacillus sp.]MDV8941119.1 polysaccharide biosynthesis protein [Latilactobacillus sp.]MDV8942903.1 polysaccharide biosynthesis protein [Latilactobacillus sp.]